MMTKLAHMRANRKNNKGFSLVELIIVIAIMVALIAVMGPQYVKYIQKSRDSALASAAEDLQAYIKTAIADPETNLSVSGTDPVTLTLAVTDAGAISLTPASPSLTKNGTAITAAQLLADAGASTTTKMGNTKCEYTITITPAGIVSMKQTKDTAGAAIS